MLTGIQSAVILYDPRAGRHTQRRLHELSAAPETLRQAGIEPELEATTGPGSAARLAQQAVEQGRQLVIVCGGDGTINEAANGTTRNRFRYLAYLPALWLGALRRMNDVHFWKAAGVHCEPIGGQKIYAQVDGEPIGTLPMEFRIVPDALTLVIPEATGAPGI